MAEEGGDPKEKRRPPAFEHGEKLARAEPAAARLRVEAPRPAARGLWGLVWVLLAAGALAWLIWNLVAD